MKIDEYRRKNGKRNKTASFSHMSLTIATGVYFFKDELDADLLIDWTIETEIGEIHTEMRLIENAFLLFLSFLRRFLPFLFVW